MVSVIETAQDEAADVVGPGEPGAAAAGSGAWYLYAVCHPDVAVAGAVSPSPDTDQGPPEGLGGAPVELWVEGSVAALVSPWTGGTVRPARAHLRAHAQVLHHWRRRGPMLPMSFGSVRETAEALRGWLKEHQSSLRGNLERLAGCVEIPLVVRWQTDDVIPLLVDRHAELRAAREALWTEGRTPTQDEKLSLGQLFEQVRERERSAWRNRVEAALEGTFLELRSEDPKREAELARLMFLVREDQQGAFEAGLERAAREWPGEIALDLGAAWLPQSFIVLDPGP
jgi:hypothetical protein